MTQPHCEITEFHPRQQAYALVIGVYNEGTKFTRQLESLQAYRQMIDIIIADGDSSDGATSTAMLEGKVRSLVISKDNQRGLSVQYRAALQYALEQGYEGVVMMDGNGKDGADAIPRFIAALERGYDFVQGSRFIAGGRHEHTPIDRVVGIRFVFNPVMNGFCRFRYTDAMNGFKGCSRAFLTDLRVQPFREVFVRYNLQYYFNYIAPRLGVRMTEIPVTRVYPNDGLPYSKINGVRARIKIIGELLATVTGRYNP